MPANDDLVAELFTTTRHDGRTRFQQLLDGDLLTRTHTFEGRVPDPPYKIPNNGRTTAMTASTPTHDAARRQVADAISSHEAPDRLVDLIVLDHDRDNLGPNGGVSNRILAFTVVDGVKVPVVIQVYADERIDEVTEKFIAEAETERTRQERYEEFLASQPVEASAIESGAAPTEG